MTTKRPTETATHQIAQALHERGYHRVGTQPCQDAHTLEWRIYIKEKHLIIMQAWRDGGCELYAPLTNTSTIRETIDAIP